MSSVNVHIPDSAVLKVLLPQSPSIHSIPTSYTADNIANVLTAIPVIDRYVIRQIILEGRPLTLLTPRILVVTRARPRTIR